ncbi:MAG: MarR family transcriptional regulator [Armatimonadetes bacterium]|nr:MarR family transcriptional regulator [Armatimonadota bacterium]
MPDDNMQQCAAQVLDTMHLIMRSIGNEIRNRTPSELSMQQFRGILAIHINKGASLSDIAEHLGSTVSSASKMVDGLVDRGLIERTTDPDDHRKLVLALTDEGKSTMDTIDLLALNCLSGKLSPLSANECAIINLAMNVIRSAFMQSPTEDARR